MDLKKTAITLSTLIEEELEGTKPTAIACKVHGTDFADFNCFSQAPGASDPGAAGRTPFDMGLKFADGSRVPPGRWAKVTLTIDCQKLLFDVSQPVVTAGDRYSAKHMRLGKVDPAGRMVELFVKNTKIDRTPFTFNLALLLGDARWQMPVFVDPKIHGAGGGKGDGCSMGADEK